MTDETEVEDEDEFDEENPEQTEVCAGTVVIWDTAKFARETKSLGMQVTDEGGVYLIDEETHRLRPLLLDDGKTRGKLTRVQ